MSRFTQQAWDMHMEYKQIFSSETGQRVLADILSKSGIFLTIPDQGESLLIYEGRRKVGNHILGRLGAFSHVPEVINQIVKLPPLERPDKEQ